MEKLGMFIVSTIKLALLALALWTIFLVAVSITGFFEPWLQQGFLWLRRSIYGIMEIFILVMGMVIMVSLMFVGLLYQVFLSRVLLTSEYRLDLRVVFDGDV